MKISQGRNKTILVLVTMIAILWILSLSRGISGFAMLKKDSEPKLYKGFYYVKNSTGDGIVIKGTDPKTLGSIVVIPSQIENLPVTSLGGICFMGARFVKITIPDTVTTIGSSAFNACENLKSLTIPNSVTAIGSAAFASCSALASIALPSKLKKLEEATFGGCTNLKQIVIPNSVTELGINVFSGCSALTSVILPRSLQKMDKWIFESCTVLTAIYLPASLQYMDEDSLMHCPGLKIYCKENTYAQSFLKSHNIAYELYSGEGTELSSDNMDPAQQGAAGIESKGSGSLQQAIPYTPDKDFEYTLNSDHTLTITGYKGTATEWNIPPVIDGKSVTKIGDAAFNYNKSLTSVILPKGLVEVERDAFSHCNTLKSVQMPDSIKSIAAEAFISCGSLEGIHIPTGLTSLGDRAFENCGNLSAMKLPDGIESVPKECFDGCSRLKSVVIGQKVQRIDGDAFSHCLQLETVTMGNEVEFIGENAFACCGLLKKLTLSQGIQSIGDFAFVNCISIEDVTLPDSLTSIGVEAFWPCYKMKVHCYDGSEAYRYAGNNGLTVLPLAKKMPIASLRTVDCSENSIVLNYTKPLGATAQKLEQSVDNGGSWQPSEIEKPLTGDASEAYVTKLESGKTYQFRLMVEGGIRAGTSNIAVGATWTIGGDPREFDYSISGDNTILIKKYNGTANVVKVPAELDGKVVTAIGDSAFANNTAIVKVDLPDTIQSIGKSSFHSCTSLREIRLPKHLAFLGDWAFYHCASLKSILLPGTLSAIGEDVFMQCYGLSSVEFSVGLTSIGNGAFSSCSSLTEARLPMGIATIGASAFEYCTKLSRVVLPDSITSIGSRAFTEGNFSSIILPSGITKLEDGVFSFCPQLLELVLPDNITQVGVEAVAYCDKLKRIVLSKNVATIGAKAFAKCNSLKSVEVSPYNSTYAVYDGVLYDKTGTRLVFYPSNRAGENFSVPAKVTAIDCYAFFDCNELKSVVLPKNGLQAGENSFYRCSSLVKLEPVGMLPKGAAVECPVEDQNFDYIVYEHNRAVSSSPDGTPLKPGNYTSLDGISDEILELSRFITRSAADDGEKMLLIHDWIAKNIYYDWDLNATFTAGSSVDQFSVDADYVLDTKKSVCQGYANLTNAMMRAAGLPCRVVTGYGSIKNRNSSTAHAWNEVYVKNKWRIIDTTWDSSNSFQNGNYYHKSLFSSDIHQFYNLSLPEFSMTHYYGDR